MWIEKIVNTGTRVAFSTYEIVKPLGFTLNREATLDQARKLENDHQWREAANEYWSLAQETNDLPLYALYMANTAQQAINLGYCKTAETLIINTLNHLGDEKTFANLEATAKLYEKVAWVNEYKGEYEKEISNLNRGVALIADIENSGLVSAESVKTYSTLIHFLGRAYYGLATKTDKDQNLDISLSYFTQHLSLLDEGINLEINSMEEKGFSHIWIARVQIKQGNFEKARESIDQARNAFDPQSPNQAHLQMVEGQLLLSDGKLEDARDMFFSAYFTRRNTDNYPLGKLVALFGVAGTYYAEGKLPTAVYYGIKGIQSFIEK